MTLTTSLAWMHRARSSKYALGAFNANTLEQMQAIVMAADEAQAPVVIQVSQRALEYVGDGNIWWGLRYMSEIGRVAAESVRAPVTLHLDHGSPEVVLQALELGFTSAMFDGGDLPYEENVRLTRALCQAAHRAGAAFEAELGEVPRLGISGAPAILTAPQQAAEFVARTGVDALAVSLGSVHAMQRKEAELDLDRLEAIRAVVDVPLVLHGSSGVTDSSLLEGIQRGLCKVNVATQLNAAFSAAIRAHLAEHPGNVDPRKYLGPARLAMQAQVRERMDVFGVTGQAAHLWEEGRP